MMRLYPMAQDFHTLLRGIMVILLVTSASACSGPVSSYDALNAARTERQRIDIVKRYSNGRGSASDLRGLAQFWMENQEYMDAHPTLSTLLGCAIHEGKYHDNEFEQWLVEVLARDPDYSRRRDAWVHISQTTWRISEPRLLEAVERENMDVAQGKYTDIRMIHDQIARTGRRLYPESTWWQPLICDLYGK